MNCEYWYYFHAFFFFFAFLISFYLTPLFLNFAYRFEFIDAPDGKIKHQKTPVPYMGGVAVYCGFLCGIAFTMPFNSQIFLFIVGLSLLLLLGLIDDFITLTPYQKFCGQIVVAFCFIKNGFYLKEHLFQNYWNMFFSFLWILTIINAFNLVDIMDGLASIIALCVAIIFLIISFKLKTFIVSLLLLSFMGSLLGFYIYNRPPASIYLGDAGALLIGGFLGSIPFLLPWGTYTPYGYCAPFIILSIPLLENVSLILIRLYKGIPFYYGSPDHFAMYLSAKGWRKTSILGYVGGMSLFSGSVAALFVAGILDILPVIAAGLIFLIVWIAVLIRK